MKFYIATDHAGFHYKAEVIEYVGEPVTKEDSESRAWDQYALHEEHGDAAVYAGAQSAGGVSRCTMDSDGSTDRAGDRTAIQDRASGPFAGWLYLWLPAPGDSKFHDP